MLSVRLKHRLGGFSLDVDFEAPPGITVLFGRSGSGKTSIVNAVAGLLTPEVGRVALGDRVLLDTADGTDLPPYRRRIGYVFQEGRLFPHLTVRQNLTYGRLFAPRGAPREDPDKIIGMLGLEPLLPRRPGHLSGGEKQRVAIGRALLSGPELILADEPLAALDASARRRLRTYLAHYIAAHQSPAIFSTHDVRDVLALESYVYVLEEGKIVQHGLLPELIEHPATDFVAEFVAGVKR